MPIDTTIENLLDKIEVSGNDRRVSTRLHKKLAELARKPEFKDMLVEHLASDNELERNFAVIAIAELLSGALFVPTRSVRAFGDEFLWAFLLLEPHYNDTSDIVIESIIYIANNFDTDNETIRESLKKFVLTKVDHPNKDIRLAVAFVLFYLYIEEPLPDSACVVYLKLCNDKSEEVRDWALFTLGSLAVNTEESIYQQLLKSMQTEKTDSDAYAETVIGLARLKDPIAKPVIIEKLNSDNFGPMWVTAAIQSGDPILLDLLKRRKEELRAKNPNDTFIIDIENELNQLSE